MYNVAWPIGRRTSQVRVSVFGEKREVLPSFFVRGSFCQSCASFVFFSVTSRVGAQRQKIFALEELGFNETRRQNTPVFICCVTPV